MELVAKKNFRGRNSRLIKKGERFSVDHILGRVYLEVGHAEYPTRDMGKTEQEVRALVSTLEVVPPTYQTRVMTAETAAPIVPAKRRPGRPRKAKSEE